ncbi:F-box domain containing protein [Tanacetum coccineum]
MDRIPSSIIFDIFSRVPARCLARSRCVSKGWCNYIDDRYLTIIHDKRGVEEPSPILYHQHLSRDRITGNLCFHIIESKQYGTSHYVLEPKEGPFLEYLHKKPLSKYSIVRIVVRGSCNGLMCLSQDEDNVITSLVVVHPLRKECYELPSFPLHFNRGIDKQSYKPDMVKKNLCTMVHVFGTNSWREIPQVPSYPITGKAVFANGCLHWLVSHIGIKNEDGGREVIWFDVNKEEFGPMVWRTMEVWVLNKQKEWVPHCRFEKETVPDGYIDVIGCWNKDGDILIRSICGDPLYAFYVYNLKSGVLHKTNLAGGSEVCPFIFMYQNTLSSIHGINTNSFSLKKTDLKKSCRDLLSFC